VSAAEFPVGYAGAGPMFAALPRGERAYRLAERGATLYGVNWPDPLSFDGCVFLDRQDAEQAADARADGEFWRMEGPGIYAARTPAAAARIAAEPGWPSVADHPSDVRLVAGAELGYEAVEREHVAQMGEDLEGGWVERGCQPDRPPSYEAEPPW
jgi:hypothetical protein